MLKKLLLLYIVFVLPLSGCGYEQGYDDQPAYQYTGQYEYDYPEEKDDSNEKVEEIVLGENAHPFAVALVEILENTDGEIMANLVDPDGSGMEGMLVVNTYPFDTQTQMGTLFYIYDGNLHYKDVGLQNFGFTTRITETTRRPVNAMGDGGVWSLSIFEMQEGILMTRMVIYSRAYMNYDNGEWIGGQRFYDSNLTLTPITYEEHLGILEQYGLNDFLPQWWERDMDDRDIILKMITP